MAGVCEEDFNEFRRDMEGRMRKLENENAENRGSLAVMRWATPLVTAGLVLLVNYLLK